MILGRLWCQFWCSTFDSESQCFQRKFQWKFDSKFHSKFDEKVNAKKQWISSRISMEISNEKIFRNFYEKSIALSWNFKKFATFVSNLYDSLSSENLTEPCHSHRFSCTPPSLSFTFWSDFGIQPGTKCVTPVLCWFMLHFWNQKFTIYCNLFFLHFSCIFLLLVKCIYATLIYFLSRWA